MGYYVGNKSEIRVKTILIYTKETRMSDRNRRNKTKKGSGINSVEKKNLFKAKSKK
jgi:hypothetical protein